ncbi:hypothetical protein [Mycolicibacterium elephantis]|uniref:hypothetical protein n=1 Tax=Mycolicibacterium elephantis TaxID=81858 RepID=UPI0007E9F729|nr:hypothetical protein [Mycolicibacterium elephantis]OBB16343.1 hypothetical protein A5762_03595 [Mycolicibacterium elephantis]
MTIAAMSAPSLFPTWNGRTPADVVTTRAADLDGIVTVPIRELTPWLPEPIWTPQHELGRTDVDEVRKRTRARLEALDWSMIKPGDRVNLIANPHGFALSGEAYVAMLEEVQRHVQKVSGATVRLRIAESMGHIENPDWMKIYDLKRRFGDARECPQIGQGVQIDTRVGPMYLTRQLFTADHFIHTHVTEMREGYLHRMVDRLYKPFGMAYTRLETRSAYHFGYGPRTGQLVARAVFDSDFVQQRYVSTVVLNTSPEGVIDVDADNDLGKLDRRVATDVFRNYAVLIRLMSEVKDVTVVFDGHGNTIYSYAGGIPFDVLYYSNADWLDLDNPALYAALLPESIRGMVGQHMMGENANIKAYVINYMAGGVPYIYLIKGVPTFVTSRQVMDWLQQDPSGCWIGDMAEVTNGLTDALARSRQVAQSDNVLVYDNLPGALHVSESLAHALREAAPRVREDVEKVRMPKWLAQRDLPAVTLSAARHA